MPPGYSGGRTSVHNLSDRFIWCPKFRKPVFMDEVAAWLEFFIEEKADELSLKVPRLAIQLDVVHLFITSELTLATNKIVQQVEGYLSRIRRDEICFGLPSLCTRSYFLSSTREVSSQTFEIYAESQSGI